MAFALEGLSVVSYADGFTLWHYRAGTDTRAAVATAGYFTAAGHMLRAGDMLVANTADGMALMVVSGAGASLRATAF
jgi:hypothetical protein